MAVTVMTALTNKIDRIDETEIPRRTQVEVLHFGIVWALQDYLLRAEQAAAAPLWS